MKNKLLKFALFTTVLAGLAGCGPTPTDSTPTSEEPVSVSELTKEEKIAVMQEVAEFVPIVTEDGTGTVIYSDQVTDLKDGRDLTVRTKVNRFGNLIDISWTYREGLDGAGNPLASYEVKPIDEETASVRPAYPVYDLVINSSGQDVSVVPPVAIGRLYANLAFGGETLRVSFDMYLTPQIRIDWKKLDVIRDTEINAVVGARGYITSIYPDYDAITIQDGAFALTLYKTQAYSGRGLKIGDFIEAAGSWRPYNGLAEIGWIVRLNLADPVEHDAALPITHEFSPADFKEWYDAETPTEQFLTALYDYDSALISIDEPMTILRAENREAVEIALADLPTTNVHANIILGATVGEGTVEIKLSISYHVGPAVQQALKDKLIAAGLGAHVTYEGILNWFNEPVLGIMSADDITVVA